MPYLGSTIRIQVEITDYEGKAVVPDSHEVKIYDPDEVLKQTFTAVSEVEAGTYYVDYTIPTDAERGKWKVVWKITKGGYPHINRSYFTVSSA